MSYVPILDRLERSLEKRRADSLFRSIPPLRAGLSCLDLSSNSYLWLQENDTLQKETEALIQSTYTGNLASRLIAETSPLYAQLENEIADWKGTECALVFNSGYAANVGVLQALCSRDTVLFCDRLNHASIIDGAILSGCKLIRYRHRNMDDLRAKVHESDAREKVIITDTIFSMDGDRAPLGDICEIAQEFGCLVIVDEAHATGVFGKASSGLVEEMGVADKVHVRIGTLSKAIAGLGGFFAGSSFLRDWFVNSSRSLIYSTGLPHSVLAHDIAAVRHIRMNPWIGQTLLTNASRFIRELNALGFDTMGSESQIVPCRVDNEAMALELSRYLADHGILAPAIRPPTVPTGTARIRFSLHAALQESDFVKIIDVLKNWRLRHG